MVVRPACIGGEGIDDTPVLVHTDRLLHCVPGDKEPVQWGGVEDVDSTDRRTPWCFGRGDLGANHRLTLLSWSTNSRRCVRDRWAGVALRRFLLNLTAVRLNYVVGDCTRINKELY